MPAKCKNNFDAPCIYAYEIEGMTFCAWNDHEAVRVEDFICPRGDDAEVERVLDNRKIYKIQKDEKLEI